MSNLFLQLFLVLTGFTFTILFLRYIFSSQFKSKEVFIAIDGTKFKTSKLCDDYNYIYKQLDPLYQEEILIKARRKNELLGLKLSFINKIKSEGFSDLNTLISFKEDFKKLAEFFEVREKI